MGAGSEVWNRVSMISPARNLAEWDWVPIFLQNKYGGECRHGRTMSFCRVLSFPASKHQEKVSWTFLMEFLDITGGVIIKMNSSWVTTLIVNRHLSKKCSYLASWIFERSASSMSFPKHMLRAHYITMSLATVIRECSLNQFSTSLFVSFFVQREPQQIYFGVNTEYRANLVKARVNVSITLPHIYWVCQYRLF